MILLTRLCVLGSACSLLLTSCIDPSREARQITISTAASTVEVVRRLGEMYTRESGTPIRVNTGASSALVQQVLAGADVDLLLTANLQWLDTLSERQLLIRWDKLLGNRLVFVVTDDSASPPRELADLAGPGVTRIAIGDPGSVPAGMYAKAALVKYGLWERVSSKLVFGFDVRQVLSFLQSGEADAAFVYSSDTAVTSGIRVVLTLDPESTGEIIYPLILLRQGGAEGERFYRFLFSEAAGQQFRDAGFLTFRSINSEAPVQGVGTAISELPGPTPVP